MSNAIAPEIVTQIRASESAETAVAAYQSIVSPGSPVLLTDQLSLALAAAIQKFGQPVADAILAQLPFVTPATPVAARQLAKAVVEHASGTEVAHYVLKWYPMTFQEPAVQARVRLETPEDISNVIGFLVKAAQDPSIQKFTFEEWVKQSVARAPQILLALLSALEPVGVKIDLSNVILQMCSLRIGMDVIFEALPRLGSFIGNVKTVQTLVEAFPDQQTEVVIRLMSGAASLDLFNDVLERLAGELTSETLPAFLQAMEQAHAKALWPTRMVTALLRNTLLRPEELINAQESQALYRNIVHSLPLAVNSSQDHAIDAVRLLNLIVADAAFATLDAQALGGIARMIADLRRQEELADVKVALLEKLDWRSMPALGSRFFAGLADHRIAPERADLLLAKILELGKYPLLEVDMLVCVLASIVPDRLRTFLANDVGRCLPGVSEKERVFLPLSERNPNNFAVLYIKYEKRLWQNAYVKSDTRRQIYKNCWTRLTFWQQLTSFFF